MIRLQDGGKLGNQETDGKPPNTNPEYEASAFHSVMSNITSMQEDNKNNMLKKQAQGRRDAATCQISQSVHPV